MKNIEKYRDELLERVNVCNWYDYFNSDDDCVQDCKSCEERFVKWLFEDSEKTVLDEKEKEYLSAVIKPFREKVSYISKLEKGYPETDQFIKISLINDEYVCLPYFNRKSRMYLGMKKFRNYTLEEIGL